MTKIPPSERIRQETEAFLQEGLAGDVNVLSTLLKLGAQRLIQEALEQEVTDFLGRGHYERSQQGREHRGFRNGYEPGHVKTAEGGIPVSIPQVRQTPEPFGSKLLQFLRQNTDVLERLTVEMYARGLSTRDIEDSFRDATGSCLISKSAVSEITETLDREYQEFLVRDLSGYDVLYLFLDAIYEPLRRAGMREGLLCSWAILRDGRRVLLGLQLGNKESYDCWLGMLRDLIGRGLKTPLTVTSDGAPGLIRAVGEVFPKSLRVRCWAHKMRNVLDKVPEEIRNELKAHLQAIRDAPNQQEGRRISEEVLAAYKGKYPAAMRSLADDLDASLAHLMVPVANRKFVRTTNLIERSFVEERRRTKVIPYFRTEKSCTKLVYATLMRASLRWQQVRISSLEHKQLRALAIQLGIVEAAEADAAMEINGQISSVTA